MKKRFNIGIIFFILPLVFFLFINFSKGTDDIWFIFSHGRYILNNGFPHIEFLTIHNELHFIMQQWGFSIIVYLLYHYLGSIGVVTFIGILNIVIMYFMYKLCYKISNNKYFSCLIAALLDVLLEFNTIIPRPQVISILILLVIVYLLERKDKSIYLLPLLSLILINTHASMWLMFFIICLPFVAEYILKKDKYVLKLLLIMLVSFLIGFINPYGIEAMTYSLSAYGIKTINEIVGEMHYFSLVGEDYVIYNSVMFLLVFIISIINIIINHKKMTIHSYLLIIGLSIMSFLNLRNIAIFLACAAPYIVLLSKKEIKSDISIKYLIPIITIILIAFIFNSYKGNYNLRNDRLDDVVNYLDKNYNKRDMVLYNDFNEGSYLEYYGYKTYIDARAELYIKKVNKKKDILDEYYNVIHGNISYDKFIDNYKFTHFIVMNKTYIYKYLSSNPNYKEVYKNNNDIYIFERIPNN